MLNRARFFAGVRSSLFLNKMTQAQVDGCNAILDGWEARTNPDLRQLAYMLATTKWETAHTMQPIGEHGGDAYFRRMYDPEGERGDFARANGNTEPGDGVKYHGRGYVQLTWRSNYAKMAELTGVDLVNEPERALEPAIAATILFEGMERGLFTGAKLSRYFNAADCNWINARRIINGTDKAGAIADIARAFNVALDASRNLNS